MDQWNRCDPKAFVACLALVTASGEIMVRDDDYLRQILIDMEAAEGWQFPGPAKHMGQTLEEARRSYHLLLLIDGGLVVPVDPQGNFCRMTGSGHDFLANTRKSDVWEAVKGRAAMLPGAGVGMLARVAEAYVMDKARELGILS